MPVLERPLERPIEDRPPVGEAMPPLNLDDAPDLICDFCDEEIDMDAEEDHQRGRRLDEEGTWVHVACFTRMIAGSEGHILGQCTCYGGTRGDPEGMSRRDAAIAAHAAWEDQQARPATRRWNGR